MIDVQLEDPPKPSGANNNNNQKKDNDVNDDFDDVMFDMTAPNTKPGNQKSKSQPPAAPSTGSQFVNEKGE